MKKKGIVLMIYLGIFIVTLYGCDTDNKRTISNETIQSLPEPTASEVQTEGTITKPSDDPLASPEPAEELAEKPSGSPFEIDNNNLIDERTALVMVYEEIYADSDLYGYAVYSDNLNGSGQGYYVVQFSYEEDGNQIMEIYGTDSEITYGLERTIELMYLGKSENGLYYTFSLSGYIADTEEEGHWSTYNYWAIAIDGSRIINQRVDENGNELDVTQWDIYDNMISEN